MMDLLRAIVQHELATDEHYARPNVILRCTQDRFCFFKCSNVYIDVSMYIYIYIAFGCKARHPEGWHLDGS